MATEPAIPDLGIDLSTETAAQLQAVAGLEAPPVTFQEWAMAVYDRLAAGETTLAADDLYLDGPSRHAVHLDDRVEHVPCVLDALIAAVRLDADPVTVRSESPVNGAVVEVVVEAGSVAVAPADAVMSYGASPHLPAPGSDDEPPLDWLGDPDSPLRGLTCDYINAFATSEALHRWAAAQDRVAVVELTFEQGLALAEVAADRLFG